MREILEPLFLFKCIFIDLRIGLVASGNAKVELDSLEKIIGSNEGVYIPLGVKHRLSNTTKSPLILIELQRGSYLAEIEFKRFEDDFGR